LEDIISSIYKEVQPWKSTYTFLNLNWWAIYNTLVIL
jgi:hypothetical protein